MKVLYLRALLCRKLIQYLLHKPTFWGLCITFFINAATQEVYCQFYKPSAVTVRMGETLPESFYQTVHQAVNAKTGKATTIKLADYRDKLIILDFWATWCGPCLGSLIKLDSLNKVMMSDQYVVIPVTYQGATEADSAFKKFRWDMTSIVGDTLLGPTFPHQGIPHMVWIKDGKVVAIPRIDYATGENITKTLAGQPVQMQMKIQDVPLKVDQPGGFIGAANVQPLITSFLSKRIVGAQVEKLNSSVNAAGIAISCINLPLEQLFYEAFKHQIDPELTSQKGDGVYIEISDSLKKIFTPPKWGNNGDYQNDEARKRWDNEFLYAYQLWVKDRISMDTALKYMETDLNRYFSSKYGVVGELQNRFKKYLVIRLIKDKAYTERLLMTKEPKTGARYGSLRGHLFERFGAQTMVIDHTGIDPEFKSSYHFTSAINNNLGKAKEELSKYGLDINLEELPYAVLVIKQIEK